MSKARRPGARLAALGAIVVMGMGCQATVPGAGPTGATGVDVAHGQPAGSPLPLPVGPVSGGPAALVDPEVGTGIGASAPGNVSEYPGASVPLGMVQFSPDTSPDRQVTTGSGYDYADSDISGFSLTHLSGDGCAIYGDIPILPVSGAVPANPEAAVQPFSHLDEASAAGNYAVRVGPGGTGQGIGVALTATTRSALGQFSFPADAGDGNLLFKVSDSANGSSASQVEVIGSNGLSGSVTSGDFCGIPGNYTLYFVAQFSENFAASGTWDNDVASSQRACTGTASIDCGAWVSFRQPGQTGSEPILAKVGISFVSAAGAAANLAAEDPGWNFRSVSGAATAEWNGLLDRVAVQGGTPAAQQTFYTALYHSMLFPSVFSDDDGQYMGFDHRVHTVVKGHVQYANFSESDIYRSEVPLLAVLLPGPTSQMVQSLLNDAGQTKGGFLPKWAIADNDAGQWDGDSADPIIAEAYAFGARQFNLAAALKAMVHGATVPETGSDRTASEPCPVPIAGLGTRAHLRSHLLSLHRRGFGDPRVLDRRLLHLATGAGRGRPGRGGGVRRAWPELAEPVQSGHRVPGGPPGRRKFPGRPCIPACESHRPGPRGRPTGFRGGQRHPVHLGGSPKPGRAVRADGRRRSRGRRAQRVLHPTERNPIRTLRLGRKRAGGVDPLRVRLRRGPLENPVGGPRHHDPAVSAHPRRRAGGGRPRGHVLVVRVGRAGSVPRNPGGGRSGHDQSRVPPGEGGRGQWTHPDHHRLARSLAVRPAGPTGDRVGCRVVLGQALASRLGARERCDPGGGPGGFSRCRLGGCCRRPPLRRSPGEPLRRWRPPPRAGPSTCPPTVRPPPSSGSRRPAAPVVPITRCPGVWFPPPVWWG